MPRNLQDQISLRIVRLSAEGYSQKEVARMLDVSQTCVSKILRRERDTGRPHPRRRGDRRSLTTTWEDRQLFLMVRDNCFISAPRLRVEMIRRFRRGLSVRSIVYRLLAAGCRSGRPAMCPRLTFDQRRHRRVEEERTEGGTLGIGGTVYSVMSLVSLCFSVIIDIHHGLTLDQRRHRRVEEERTEGGTSGIGGTVCSVMSLVSRCFCGGHGPPSSESGQEPYRACFGPKWIRDMDEPASTVPELWRDVLQGEDLGGEHPTPCVCSSRRQRRSHKLLMMWWHGCKHV